MNMHMLKSNFKYLSCLDEHDMSMLWWTLIQYHLNFIFIKNEIL